MRTITASKVIAGAVELTGRLFTKLNNDELQVVLRSFGRNLHAIWETEFWPALMSVEKRYFRETHVAATSYAADTEVYHTGTDAYYKNTSGGATTGTPGTSSDWTAITDYTPNIDFQQVDQNEIGQVLRVTEKDPREYLNQDSVAFSLRDDSILIDYAKEKFYWLEYRQQCPLIDARKYSSSTSYNKGDVVYYYTESIAKGRFFKALQDSIQNVSPGSSPPHWEEISIPFFTGPYLEHAIAADILLVDEKIELAGIQMRARDRALEQEMQRVKNQSGDAFSPRFKTY